MLKKPEDYRKTAECKVPSTIQLEEPAMLTTPTSGMLVEQVKDNKLLAFFKGNRKVWRHPGLIAFVVLAVFSLLGLGLWLIFRGKEKPQGSMRERRSLKRRAEPVEQHEDEELDLDEA